MSEPSIDPGLLAAFRRAVRNKIARDLEREEDEARELRAAVMAKLSPALAHARAGGLCEDAWLFGSFAWGTPRDASDIDLLVAGCSDPDALGGRLMMATSRAVHVVPMEQAPASLKERVLAEGTRL